MEANKPKWPLVVAGSVFLLWMGGFKLDKFISFGPNPISVVDFIEPSSEVRSKFRNELDTITREVSSYKSYGVPPQFLGDHYRDFAKYVLSNENLVKNNEDVRKANVTTTVALFDRYYKTKGTNKDFTNAVESVLQGVLTKDNAQLNENKRKELVDAVNAIAWACYKG